MSLFGPFHVIKYIQSRGEGSSSEFSQYGGVTESFGFDGGGQSQNLESLPYQKVRLALYYVNAIESVVAAIEISAISDAKSTATRGCFAKFIL